jgi:hypothetical protein
MDFRTGSTIPGFRPHVTTLNKRGNMYPNLGHAYFSIVFILALRAILGFILLAADNCIFKEIMAFHRPIILQSHKAFSYI